MNLIPVIVTSIGQSGAGVRRDVRAGELPLQADDLGGIGADHCVKSASGAVITIGSAVATATRFLTGKL